MVCGKNGIFIVLHDDHTVAHVAQTFQGVQQAAVVALMQSNGRLVQHIHHTGQARAYLRGQADALRLATGQRFCRAIQRQIIQSDIVKEGEATDYLLHDPFSNRLFVAGQLHTLEESQRLLQRHGADLVNSVIRYAHMARFNAQARTLAFGTAAVIKKFCQLLTHGGRLGFFVAPFKIGDYAFEAVLAQSGFAALVEIVEGDLLLAAAE